jgi:hypothetical protein
MTDQEEDADDLVPVSVRLGAVVPPEDPEDWTRPLTWVAAIGMLAAPAVALGWFVLGAPGDNGTAVVGTYVVAVTLAIGAAAAGATQIGRARAVTGTLGAGLLAALLVVIAGAVTAGERQLGSASPTLAQALAAAVAGLAGVVPAALLAGLVARHLSRRGRGVVTAVVAAIVTTAVLPNLFWVG